ncbi:MAG TPA: type II toxin-antitoxin system RelE/ParE family toxin [Tepidisphaeraceae bacterium]|nr:type II toxin-antitoxin system RelE/ParE family toxin [Tepidisphaeraceae bacterium]
MNHRRFRISPLADADIDGHCAYIGRGSVDAALRFVEAFYDDCIKLSAMPGMGARRELHRPELRELRSWPITGFENRLIFYKPSGDTIEVVRVLHGAQDVENILNSSAPST